MKKDGKPCKRAIVIQPAAERAIRKWWPQPRDREEIRRQITKLAYWPGRQQVSDDGLVVDVNWSRIRSCRRDDIFEQRIADKIGGHSNIRVIFTRVKCPVTNTTMIYVLTVMPKKRQDFSRNDVETFRAGRKNVMEFLSTKKNRLRTATS